MVHIVYTAIAPKDLLFIRFVRHYKFQTHTTEIKPDDCISRLSHSIQPSFSFQLLLYVEVDVSGSGKLTLLLIFTNPIH